MVKTVLRQEAADLGVAYWDWSRLTRGPCGVDAMTRADPPLAQADHVLSLIHISEPTRPY